MEDGEKKSAWDELARELGANPPATEPPQERPEESAAAATKPERTVELPADPPKSPPSGWDSLANDFGIEPAKRPDDEHPASTTQTKPASVAAPNDRSPDEKFSDERDEVDEEDTEVDALEQEPIAPRGRHGSAADSQVAASVDDMASGEGQSAAETGKAPTEAPAPVPQQERRADPVQQATSFWQSIFGHSSKPGEAPIQQSQDEASEMSQDAALEEVSKDESVAEEAEEGSQPAEREAKRGRSRRRRGRGRSRDREKPSPQPREEVDAEAEEDESISDADDDFADPDDDDSESDDDARPARSKSGTRSKSAHHRSIPSWDEAIGEIVAANLAQRSTRKRSAPRGGNGRGGRPRGRRKKKT